MHRPAKIARLLALAVVACQQPASSATTPQLMDVALDRSASAESAPSRRIAGRCETVLAPPVIVSPGVVRQVDTGLCQLSHLGRAAFSSDKVIQLAAGTQTTAATFTAPDGDVLEATGSGTNVPIGQGRVRFTATLTFTGGTGRFSGASGEAFVEGEADVVNRTSSLSLEGTIAYDASDRSTAEE